VCKTGEKKMRWVKGQSGNTKGRPAKPAIHQLQEALSKAAHEHHGKTLIEHAVKEAYSDNGVLIAILKKILPDMSQQELKAQVKGGGITIQVIKKYEGVEPGNGKTTT